MMRRWRGISGLGSIWPFSVWRREAKARRIRAFLDTWVPVGPPMTNEEICRLIHE
jgi:hypothetical protein